MSVNRYSQTPLIRDDIEEPVHYATFDLPYNLKTLREINWFEGTTPRQYVWKLGDRMDKIASKFFDDDQLWWVIMFANNINYPLGIKPGTVINIPRDPSVIIEKLGLR